MTVHSRQSVALLADDGWRLRKRALVRLAITLLGFGLTLLLLLSPVWAAGGLSSLTAALRRETSTLATLESLTEWVARTEQDLEEARQRRGEVEHQTSEAERRIKALEERSTQRRHHVQQRVRSIYKMSRGGILRLLLEAVSGEDLSIRVSAAALILRRDARELALYRQELGSLAAEQRTLAEKRAQQRQAVERLEAKTAELRTARSNQVKLLRRLQASRRLQHQVADELDQQQRALLRRIGEITWRLQVAGGFAARKGKLGRPVAGPIIGVFGRMALDVRELSAERGDGATAGRKVEIMRHGLTFRPRGRSPVGAVAPGVVRLAGSLRGYGNVVLVEHSDGYYTLSAFLSQVDVAEGAEVDKGTRLGRAGFDPLTGRAAMYFELRHGAQALDPAVWLRR